MSVMMDELPAGRKVSHRTFGIGYAIEQAGQGYVLVMFEGAAAPRNVPVADLTIPRSREDDILAQVASGDQRRRSVRLAIEGHELPLMDDAPALTSARIDLLPHQVVLTHRVATTTPRRFLIADEVGLGKTIETALILRELASRNEMVRALVIVPAGLVNNWNDELNGKFNMDFEVFGVLGDVNDRHTNAFAKHDRLIASVDTLKRPKRMENLLNAPKWDLIVFDEAHHVSAYRRGKGATKTQNYQLAEALMEHTRDLLLLSATPHQGDHFRFWMLLQLLDPSVFGDQGDMIENRHRLNQLVIRRSKADACRPDGSTLFARRKVHTEARTMAEAESRFYDALRLYLNDGFNLAKNQGKQGNALGFLMTIFQKIAASSFAAVRRTLERRIINLTVYEALLCDRNSDAAGREELLAEARSLLHRTRAIDTDILGKTEVEGILSELRFKIAKALSASDASASLKRLEEGSGLSDAAGGNGEEAAEEAVRVALPEERKRIRTLLDQFPEEDETKIRTLVDALRTIWAQDAAEKVVIFATYIGTVDLIERQIKLQFPDKGVVVLKGGSHENKQTAEKRFRHPTGPRVIVCTAAGREGINLQHSRILFNFDLPWNPMDIEQRIGRIHRYGQQFTAQVYNLVLSDTIEGKIFGLLNAKLLEIARAIGKVDDEGNVAEDLQVQILGQLSEHLKYDELYRDALDDPQLVRTEHELTEALRNAREANNVVFELFQNIDRFNIADFQQFENVLPSLERIVRFLGDHAEVAGDRLVPAGHQRYDLVKSTGEMLARFTLDRDEANRSEDLTLLGLDHPLVDRALDASRKLDAASLGVVVPGPDGPGVLTWWHIDTTGARGERRNCVVVLGISPDGQRKPALEHVGVKVLDRPGRSQSALNPDERANLLKQGILPMLERELRHRDIVRNGVTFECGLIAWVEVSA